MNLEYRVDPTLILKKRWDEIKNKILQNFDLSDIKEIIRELFEISTLKERLEKVGWSEADLMENVEELYK